MDAAGEIIAAQVRSYAKQIGLTHHQVRACVRAALNKWGSVAAEQDVEARRLNETVHIGTATSEGRHVAGQFARGNHHG